MPVSIPYDWSQDEQWIHINARLPMTSVDQASVNQSINLIISPLFVQWNHPPCLLALDLLHSIDTNQSKYIVNPVDPSTNRANHVTIKLRKCEPTTWAELIDESLSRTARIERRQQSIQRAEQAARARYQSIKEQSIKQTNIEREALWAAEESIKQSIQSAKSQERVVTLDEMKKWTNDVRKEESKQLLEDNSENQPINQSYVPLPQRSEPRLPTDQSINHPVRCTQTARVVTSFTAPNPKFPSLPARQSNNPSIDQSIKQVDSASVTSLLEVKDRADSLLKARDYLGAINAYNTMLENPVFKDTSINQPTDQSTKPTSNQYMGIRCRMLSNLSTAHSALANQTSVKSINQSIHHSQLAIDTANQSMKLINHLMEGDQQSISLKLHIRIASNHAKWGRWTEAQQHWQQAQSINQSINQSNHEQATNELNRIDNIQKSLQDGEFDSLLQNARTTINQLTNQPIDQQNVQLLIDSLTRAIELNPVSADAYDLRMRAHRSINQWKDVVRDATWTITLREHQSTNQPINPSIKQSLLAFRALAYHRQGDLTSARTDLRSIMTVEERNTADQSLMLTIDRLIDRLNCEVEAANMERDVKHALINDQYEQARNVLTKLLELHASMDRMQFCTCQLINQPTNLSINQSTECQCDDDGASWTLRHCVLIGELARCEMKLENFQQASKSCTRAIRIFDQSISQPTNQLTDAYRDWRTQISVKLGTCYLELGEIEQGKNCFVFALNLLDPNSQQAHQLINDIKQIDEVMQNEQVT